MACKRIAKDTTQQESTLFDYIYDKLANKNEEKADELYAYFQSPTFKEDFGDWTSDFKNDVFEREINQRLLDDNGEPRLFYDKAKAKHFYRNKNNSKVYYPNNINKLTESYSHEAIRNITEILALKFIQPRLNNNFETLELSELNTTLSNTISDIITKKSSELIDSEDFEQQLKGEVLKDSLEYLDEWVRNVENYYRELKLIYKEDSDTEDTLHNEESTRTDQVFGMSSFERSTKDNISSNIKLRLSLLVSEELDDMFYEPKFLSFDEVYSTLQGNLTSKIALQGEDLFEIYKQELFNLQDKKPFLNNLLRQFDNISPNQKAEFVQAFNLDKNNFIGTTYQIEPIVEQAKGTNKTITTGYKTTVIIQNLSNSGGKTRLVKNNWFYNFNKNFSNSSSEYDKASVEKLNSIKAKYDKFFVGVKTNIKNNNYTEENISIPVNSLITIFNELGIATTSNGFNHYLDGLNPLEANFEDKITNFNKLLEATKYFLDNTTLGGKELINPFDAQNEFNKLAQAESFYMSEGSDASIFSVGKSKWIYSYPSYLSNKIKEWKKDRSIMLDQYQSIPYNESSHYMKWFLAINENLTDDRKEEVYKERIEAFELNIFNSLQETGDSVNAVGNVNMSKSDAFADNFNKILGYRVKGKKTYTSTPTPADKSTQYQFTLPSELMLSVNARAFDNKVEINESAKKVVYSHVKAEFNRIKQVKKEIELAGADQSKLITHYHLGRQNGLKFQTFPTLNMDNFDSKELGFELYEKGSIIDLELKDLTNVDDLSELDPGSIEAKLITFITNKLGEKITETRDHLQTIGMVERIDGKFINKAFDTDIWNSYGLNQNNTLQIAGDIYINNLLSQIEYSKMFTGDVAYYKNMADYKKRLPATYTDGLQLYLQPGEEYFNVAIIEGVEVPAPYMQDLIDTVGQDIADKYSSINSTDAQAWITPARWKFLKEKLGKFSEIDSVVFDKMTGVNTEDFTNTELKHVAQPLKGVYFEINNGVPTFLKYSQAVLLPKLIENSPGLKALHNKMIVQDIDELITIDGIKVGANKPSITHDNKGDVLDNFELTVLPLKNSGWKLQQDLPTKTFKDTDIGSQIQKNIFSGLVSNLDETFDVDGVEMSGKDLIKFINSIVGKLSDIGLRGLFEEFGIDSEYNITNQDRLNKSLIEELKGRGASQNVIDALESGISPYAIPGYQQKLQNVFASMVLNRVVKIQTNGGSFIQMSNYGFNNDEANNKGVIYTPWAKDKVHEPTIIKGVDGAKDTIRPGGVLISGSFIVKYIPNYKKYANNPDKLFGTAENNYTDGLIDKKILDSLIGYRIPNQGLSSNDALEVVGILPEEAGDTIVAYTGITTKTGSDFDIDKMYIMMPSFRPKFKQYGKVKKYLKSKVLENSLEDSIENLNTILDDLNYKEGNISTKSLSEILLSSYGNFELEEYLINEVTNAIVNSDTKLAKQLKLDIPGINIAEKLEYIDSNTKEGLQNQLIQAYKSVLTHPSNIKDIMTPVDFEFIKDDILDLYPEPEIKDLDSFSIIEDINLKYEFLAGQAGVGITANQLVDHVRGRMANLRLPYLGIGSESIEVINNNDVKYSKLDSEYSEELSIVDYKYYISQVKNSEGLKKIKIANSLSAIMNANVDIAKDSYITRGNWTTQTSNVGQMLIRAGIHPFKVNALLGQPIIKEYVEFINNSESKIVDTTGDLMNKFIEGKIFNELKTIPNETINGITVGYRDLYLATKYGNIEYKFKKLFKSTVSEEDITRITNKLKEVSDKYKPDTSNFNLNKVSLRKLRDQIKTDDIDIDLSFTILSKFKSWNETAKELGNNINASKHDVGGYGKNIVSMIIHDNLINKLLGENSIFKGFESKLKYDGENTLSNHYKINSVDEIAKIMQANPLNFITAHPTVINTFNEISKGITGDVLLKQNLADKLDKHFYTYFMSGFTPLKMNEVEKDDLLRKLPSKIVEYKKNNKDDKFINELDVKIGVNKLSFLSMSNRKKSPSAENEIIIAWKDLLEEEPEVALDLVKYSVLTSGLQMNMNQFYTYIPYEFFAENNINDYIKDVASNLNSIEIDSSFIDSFFRHNIKDNQVVSRVFGTDISKTEDSNISGFVLEEPGESKLYVKKDVKSTNPVTQSITTSQQLFKLEGYTEDNRGVYTRAVPLGYQDVKGNKVFEYNYSQEKVPTIFKNNRITGILSRNNTGEIEDSRDEFRKLVDKDADGGISKDANEFNNSIEQKDNNQLDLFNNDPFLNEENC